MTFTQTRRGAGVRFDYNAIDLKVTYHFIRQVHAQYRLQVLDGIYSPVYISLRGKL